VTIQDYGSIGELIGAIATVATLAYLAFQIRQNTVSVRAASAAANLGALNAISSLIGQSQETSDLYYKGLLDPDSLTDSETWRFFMLVGIYSQYFVQAEELEAAGTLSPDAIHNRDSQLEWAVSQPGFRSFYAAWGGTTPPRLARRIEEAIRRCDEEGRFGNRGTLGTPSSEAAAQQGAAADRATARSS